MIRTLTISEAAEYLANENHNFYDTIVRTYWFPDPSDTEVRLVHIDTGAYGGMGRVQPFHFGRSVSDGYVVPRSAIAQIPLEEERNVPLPDGWGDWDNATIWEWNN